MAEGFEGLEAWRKAHELKLFVHQKVVPLLPHDEKWDLGSQIRRSSKSITANIAEGYGRYYYMDNVRFCYQARGSLFETINHLIDARDLTYISLELYAQARAMADEVSRVLNGYIAYLKKSKQGEKEPGANLALRESFEEYETQPEEFANP
ncbi:MAG: four helix bundle protein [Chloroflexota bacterium]|nr:four helix bundle protein [Chloroflexota bacterium]